MARLAPRRVLGLGDPVMDVVFSGISVAALEGMLHAKQGGCLPIDHAQLKSLAAAGSVHAAPVRIPGGSAANVTKGLANLSGGGLACTFVGMVGRDATAADYRAMLQQQHVTPLLLESDQGPTASCLCFVTPDGQRTMRTCLGASAHLTSAAQLPAGWADGAALLHCEGYCLYRPQLAREAMAAAKAAGARVSLDLASFECVANCRGALLELLQAGLVDLLFANEEEALALLQQLGPGEGDAAAAASAPGSAGEQVEAAQRFVLCYAHTCVVSLGARGCVARSRCGASASAPAGGVRVVDTIGAGDTFTAGFLYATLLGCSLAQACAIGCAAGSQAVQTRGAVLSEASWQQLRQHAAGIVGAQGQQQQQLQQQQLQQQHADASVSSDQAAAQRQQQPEGTLWGVAAVAGA